MNLHSPQCLSLKGVVRYFSFSTETLVKTMKDYILKHWFFVLVILYILRGIWLEEHFHYLNFIRWPIFFQLDNYSCIESLLNYFFAYGLSTISKEILVSVNLILSSGPLLSPTTPKGETYTRVGTCMVQRHAYDDLLCACS